MASLGLQGQSPFFNANHHPQLALAHVTSVPPFVKDFDAALLAHRTFKKQALANPSTHEVRIRDDLDRRDSTGLIFGMQHAPEKMTWTRMSALQRAGLKVMALACGDGSAEYGSNFRSEGGLTTRGRKLIEWMDACGMILDLSRANERTSCNALDFISDEKLSIPLMTSHSGCYSVCPHPRNLTDEIIGGIHFFGGYVGIPLITSFLTWKGDEYLEAFGQHVACAIRMCGHSTATVGVGSGCSHVDMTMAEAEKHFSNMTKSGCSVLPKEYFPDRPPKLIEHGGHLFEVLRGELRSLEFTKFPEHVLHGLLGGNFKSFLRRSLPRRA